jgi:hypothetical protein
LGMDDGASYVFALVFSVGFGAWMKFAYGVTILERSDRAVTLRMERRGRGRQRSLLQRVGLFAVGGLVVAVALTAVESVLVRIAPSAWSSQTSTPPRLDDSGRLPVIQGPSGESRIEPRFGRAAAIVAGLGTEVRCWSVADWQKRQADWGNWRGQSLGPWGAYMNRGTYRVHLSPSICATLARLVYEDVHVRKDPWPEQLAWSVGALAHEAQHVRGVLNEIKAECYGVQSIGATVEALGRTSEEGRYLASLYWRSTYLARDPQYRSDDCRNGGRLDLHPLTGAWP